MKKVIYHEFTSDNRIILYCTNGEGTGDVEAIELPNPLKEKNCDCEWELVIKNGCLCEKCEKKFYDFVLNRKK